MSACLSIRRHAEANCIKKHARIDDFSLNFEQKLKHEKSSRRMQLHENMNTKFVFRSLIKSQEKYAKMKDLV